MESKGWRSGEGALLSLIWLVLSPPFILTCIQFTARVDDGVCDVVLTFTSVDKILWCHHSNEISLEVLSCGVICFKKFYKMKLGFLSNLPLVVFGSERVKASECDNSNIETRILSYLLSPNLPAFRKRGPDFFSRPAAIS